MLSVTPFLIHVYAAFTSPPLTLSQLLRLLCLRWKHAIQFIAFHLFSIGMQVLIFCFLTTPVIRPLPYLVFPVLVAGVFFQIRWGWTLVVVSNALICSWASLNKRGAFYEMAGRYEQGAPRLIIQIELYVAVVALVGIFLAAAVAETQQLTKKLSGYNQLLEQQVEERTKAVQLKVKELEASQARAEKASRAKSDFLANMSHEIRTPIHGILGMTGLLLESSLNSDQRDNLLSLKECADLLLHIINSILDLAKIEAGRLEVECVHFSIRQMVSSTMRMLLSRAQSFGLKLLCSVDADVPDLCRGDPGKLQQCLLNLVGNALKFTQKGSVTVKVSLEDSPEETKGKATIGSPGAYSLPKLRSWSSWPGPSFKVEPVEDSPSLTIIDGLERPSQHQPGKHSKLTYGSRMMQRGKVCVLFEVRDTGIGISHEKLQDIFNPFTQADASTSRLYGGTGLGLCIVQRFCELLGGRVWAESKLGAGSVFYFTIPVSVDDGDSDSVADGNFGSPKSCESSHLSSTNGVELTRNEDGAEMFTLDRTSSGKYSGQAPKGSGAERAWYMSSRQQQDMQSRIRGAGEFPLARSMSDPGFTGRGNTKYKLRPAKSPFLLSTSSATQLDDEKDGGTRVDDGSDGGTISRPLLTRNWCASPRKQPNVGSNQHPRVGVRDAGFQRMVCIPEARHQASPAAGSDGGGSPVATGALVENHGQDVDFDMEAQQEQFRPGNSAEILQREYSTVPSLQKPCVLPNSSCGREITLPCSPPRQQGDNLYSLHKDVESENGTGTPMLHCNVSKGRSAMANLRLKKELNVLLAEDNIINQKVACRLLQRHGHTVTVVEDGLQALNFVRENHASLDLIVMDVQMPKMDGLEATRNIREEEDVLGLSRIPILGSTAHAIQGYQDVCFYSGMDGYLGKPFNADELMVAVGRVIHGSNLDHG
eukprot:TRINITY_DN4535_c0_g1_i1.p1 TRINITY_DN4535_c0_g1~~TRINITY_DN4535_c0_g1_i1.p1  ORF type:complete len:950 (-),score=142.11 TRINITY_DN4535_c0_g1_i1:345-3143(-)